MENILITVLKAGELVVELWSTVCEKLRSDDDTSEDGREQSPNGEDP
ncbi:hypothetical protein JCM17092_27330 [Haloplanus litoreus]